MNVRISHTASAQKFLEEVSGQLNDQGNPRTKALVYRILRDSVNIIEDLAVTPEEFWKAVNYLNVLGARHIQWTFDGTRRAAVGRRSTSG